ncbi:MAG: ImmA/IrrE family metallo-endopeptidase [Micrococcales bacterium]|nr:ImmA/IrrE family metallo-endopeptidase [Micrococcales bacterium]
MSELVQEALAPSFPDRFEAIRFIRSLARAARIRSGQVGVPVADPILLARSYMCKVVPGSLNPDGLDDKEPAYVNSVLVKPARSKKAVLVVESQDEEPRQRFSIAHELGHLIMVRLAPKMSRYRYARELVAVGRRAENRPLDGPFQVSDDEYFHVLPSEYYADLFAHMFLMPTEQIAALVSSCETDGGVDYTLHAPRFGVTPRSLRNRLQYYLTEVEDVSRRIDQTIAEAD